MARLLALLVAACLLLEGLPAAWPQVHTGDTCCESEACCCAPVAEAESCCAPEREAPRPGPKLSQACSCGDHGPAHVGTTPQPRSACAVDARDRVDEVALPRPDTAPPTVDAPPVEPLRRPPRRA